MKPLLLAFFVLSCGAAAASAAEAGSVENVPAETAAVPQDAANPAKPASTPQDLVEAARANKAKRKKSTTKVITNADVKKAKSKLLDSGAPATPVAPEPSMLEKQASEKAARADANATRAATEELIGELEAELSALEQSYYDENDLNRRDTELVKRFNDVKAKLDAARSALAQIP